jgi:uncharacterized protein YbjT (DUF2867 family)
MSEKQVIITGATGMIGGCVLHVCLDDPDVSMVTVVGRRSTGVKHAKMREVHHEDFMDYSSIAETPKNQDVALYCLGAYTGAVPDDLFRQITVDYTLEFARSLHRASPQAEFCFLSGQGADQTEQSRVAFARYKGAAEKELLKLGFPRVHIFRPGYIYPVTPRKEPNILYRLFRVLYPVLRHVYPNIGVSSEDLASTMMHIGLHGIDDNENSVLENRDIRVLARL